MIQTVYFHGGPLDNDSIKVESPKPIAEMCVRNPENLDGWTLHYKHVNAPINHLIFSGDCDSGCPGGNPGIKGVPFDQRHHEIPDTWIRRNHE